MADTSRQGQAVFVARQSH